VISRKRLNGTFDIDYDDGEKETDVEKELIKVVNGAGAKGGDVMSDDDRGAGLQDGAKIEARYKGNDKYYPGVISRKRLNGPFDIVYDDGEKESGVSKELIRMLGVASRSNGIKKTYSGGDSCFDVRSKIEARYKGYPGVISRNRLNNTFDIIDYDDGEKETDVEMELIKVVNGAGEKGGDDMSEDDRGAGLQDGAKIEARYKGKDKYYPGVISRKRLNGTFDIDYDDGGKESGCQRN
jgi:translation elongation factor P/translation initiation factor 5A